MPELLPPPPSITTWTRIEPRCCSADGTRSGATYAEQLEARIHDPLWLLTRQWQVGEFDGEDTATPISARLNYTLLPITRYRLGDDPATHDFMDSADIWAEGARLIAHADAGPAWKYQYRLPTDSDLRVRAGDSLWVDVYMVSRTPNATVILRWVDFERGETHAACWGPPTTSSGAVNMGPLGSNDYQRLLVPASGLALEGRTVVSITVTCNGCTPVAIAATGRQGNSHRPPIPLEVIIERDDADDLDLLFAAETGAHFFRILGRRLTGSARSRLPIYRAAYNTDRELKLVVPILTDDDAIRLDEQSRRFLMIMSGRVPNGVSLARAVRRAEPDLHRRLNINPADDAVVAAAHAEWLSWYDSLVSTRPTNAHAAWQPSRFEYRFEALTSEAGNDCVVVLHANEYRGDLDWYSFDTETRESPVLPTAPNADRVSKTERRILTEPDYPGMPNRRFWQFEDARVDLGNVATSPGDVASLLVALFAVDYGNDWYRLPLTLPVGTLCRINSLDIQTTFGTEWVNVPPYGPTGPDKGLTLFQLSALDDRPQSLLLLPPVLPTARLRGEPLQEVRLLRDELANVGFGIESTVTNLIGRPIHRDEERQRPEEEPPSAPGAAVAYRLRHDPPSHWIALIPQLPDGSLLEVVGQPLSTILKDHAPICDEEIRYEGLTIASESEYARWTDGSTFLWTGRRAQPGARNASSGLRFDLVVDATDTPPAEAGHFDISKFDTGGFA